ncbi:PTS sugar transporter subunit IIC [Erwinia psidii]|uniref:Permease IIC component n=1 Tax=Erwinia psidii TaxID=69224 RepID=A0A3N6USR2_9GAMM|nr:PTS transporter subunit EIIC [Erwinia psidii]MCX8958618.1 PTS sugar transporter subunit IIC [Erwinia psidii]MCX8963286.1 PTS sugar transporter subunit IIC [Erwinia psidii]MCX8967091.1 PTS sugar transporter subunit IIC [Erwinia psidii]RQM39039.1 PTS sugar transporter subunit IIC [Erwinia psidii]
MDGLFNGMRNLLQKGMGVIQKSKYVQAISGGMMLLLPVLMVGSFASVSASINIDSWQALIISTGLKSAFTYCTVATMNIISIYVASTLAYKLAELHKKDGIMSATLAVMAFFLLTPVTSFEKIKAIELTYLGARGMIVAMVTGLVTARLYIFLIDSKVTIKLPDSVPDFVSKSFSSLIPAFIIGLIFAIINVLFELTPFRNIHDFIYSLVQGPLQGLGTSLTAALFIVFLAEFLWFFGIHGTMATSAILFTLFYPLDVENLNAFQVGEALPFIVTMTFINAQKGPRYLAMSILLLCCKSVQMKSIGKIGVLPGCFGISEPYKFGLPMVLNPVLFLPLMTAGTLNVMLSYFATKMDVIPRVNGMPLPSAGTPEIIKGFMIGGWQMALWHIVLLIVAMLVYYPFIRYMDRQKLIAESAVAQ